MQYFLQILVDTIVLASLYSLIGVGFSLRYSITKYLDIGYAMYMTIGAYAYLTLSKHLGIYALPFAIAFSALLAYSVEKLYFSKLEDRKSSPMILMIGSLGFMTLAQAIIAMIYTSNIQSLRVDTRVFEIGSVVITDVKIATVVTAIIILGILTFLMMRTKYGRYYRAINDNKELAFTTGIPVKKISILIAIVSASIASLAGILFGMDTSIDPLMGMSLLLSGVTAAIISDVHDAKKVCIGALILAILQNTVVWYIGGEWKDACVFLLLILILLIKPSGLLSKRHVRNV